MEKRLENPREDLKLGGQGGCKRAQWVMHS